MKTTIQKQIAILTSAIARFEPLEGKFVKKQSDATLAMLKSILAEVADAGCNIPPPQAHTGKGIYIFRIQQWKEHLASLHQRLALFERATVDPKLAEIRASFESAAEGTKYIRETYGVAGMRELVLLEIVHRCPTSWDHSRAWLDSKLQAA
jgi:hypothetical protein